MPEALLQHPTGAWVLTVEDGALIALRAASRGMAPTKDPRCANHVNAVADALDGSCARYPLPLRLRGTAFQRQVWDALLSIPYGHTISYGALAAAVGAPRAARAVGTACGANPLAVVIPCHRVVASNGTLGGYAYGLTRKQHLLEHERACVELHIDSIKKIS